jgi:glycosyltransferase involved in cell wall biosynthesis
MAYTKHSISAVITAYNMAWCVGKSIQSCQSQSYSLEEIIVVDDCSTDKTAEVIKDFAAKDPRVRYIRTPQNGGHFPTLKLGMLAVKTDWLVLLDGDDELPVDSVKVRIEAACKYFDEFHEYPQLVYGDMIVLPSNTLVRFAKLSGHSYDFLSRELSLCATSTILLGRQAVDVIPVSVNPWCTDDEVVLKVGKRYPVLHSGAVVATYLTHGSETRLSNNPDCVYKGIRLLIRDYKEDIVSHHGYFCLLLWHGRLLRAYAQHRLSLIDRSEQKRMHQGRERRTLIEFINTGITKRILTRFVHFMDAYFRVYFFKNSFF